MWCPPAQSCVLILAQPDSGRLQSQDAGLVRGHVEGHALDPSPVLHVALVLVPASELQAVHGAHVSMCHVVHRLDLRPMD